MADNPAMAKEPIYERFGVELLGLYIGGFILAFGWLLFAPFTPQFDAVLNPAQMWFLVGLVVTAVGFGGWGAAAEFRHRTEKLMAANRMFQLAFGEPRLIDVSGSDAIDADIGRGLTPEQEEEVRLARETAPGTNSMGQRVPKWLYLPGGIHAHGFSSIHPGSQGAIFVEGNHQVIKTDFGVVIPYLLEPRDHTEVPVAVLIEAERDSYFVRGKSPIYSVGDMDPRYVEHLQTSPEVHSVVLKTIGYDGLGERFAARLTRLYMNGTLRLPIHQTEREAAKVVQAFTDSLRVEFVKWLKEQAPLKVAMGNGFADLSSYRRDKWELLGQLNRERARLRVKEDALYNADKAFAGQFRERGDVWGTGGGNGRESYDLAKTRPATTSGRE